MNIKDLMNYQNMWVAYSKDRKRIVNKSKSLQELLKNRKVTNPLDCLFDTGADRILLPGIWGEALGLKVRYGKEGKTVGIDNKPLTTYTHKITIYVGTYRIVTDADFAYENTIPLLGREGFMEKFEKIEFNQNKRYVELFYK